jgi:acid phosphatase type 7
VYVVNSYCRVIGGCGAGTPQEAWLLADLEANPRECVLAMWHEPYFTSEANGGSDSMRQMWRVLYDHGAEIILNADHHVYERFAPQTPSGKRDPQKGIVQFVVGTGGGRPERFGDPMPNSDVRVERVFGVLRLELSPSSYTFEFVDVGGHDVVDKGRGQCH